MKSLMSDRHSLEAMAWNGVRTVQPVHPAVLGGGRADVHVLQQGDGVVVLAVGDREGNGDLPVSRLVVSEDRFEDHVRHSFRENKKGRDSSDEKSRPCESFIWRFLLRDLRL